MKWRIVEVSKDDERDTDLTSPELVGLSILAIQNCNETNTYEGVYFNAWEKIQPMVNKAIEDE